MQNGTVTLENGLAVSNKVKHILTIKPCNWEFREMKIYVQTKDYTNIYSAFWWQPKVENNPNIFNWMTKNSDA